MIALACAVLVALIVLVIVLTAVMGWGHRVTRCQRVALCVAASGLVLASPARFAGPVGFADLMFLSGLAAYFLARNLKYILRRADALDGLADGRLTLPPTRELIARVRQVTGDHVSRR